MLENHEQSSNNGVTATLLLVDDDQDLNRLVVQFLSKNGYRVLTETDGGRALKRINQEQPNLVILDVMLPGRDGLSICRDARTCYAGPILMLTALGEDIDEVAGLETGADDYLAKPVRPRVLLARVRALLRRHDPASPASTSTPNSGPVMAGNAVTAGELTLNPKSRDVHFRAELLHLTDVEFDLLYFLARHAGQVLSRDAIYRGVCNRSYDGQDRTIDLRVSRLRKKLGDDPEEPAIIKSVRGVGYVVVP